MIALFKSHYSIGKSILTLSHPSKVQEDGPQSVFSIAENEDSITLVEDSLVGFLQAQKTAESMGKHLIFGLRISCSHLEVSTDSDSPTNHCCHKLIIFAKNDVGCSLLNKIYSHAFCNNDGVIDIPSLKEMWSNEDLQMAIPFYDSFIFMNSMHFCSCIPDFSFCDPHFFLENNYLPFDQQIRSKVIDYCENFKYNYSESKSIYYNKKEDFEAYQTYKCICAKRNGKQRTLSVPNFDHLSSPEFSYESYLETKYEQEAITKN